ncbi:MAG: hypothetical protein OXD31_17200 [Chloroflexi bacterium]|nr:hypothetical protein [Chloroflexota bacterium]
MISYIASESDLSRLEYLVLTAIQHLNARAVAADSQTVSTVLMLVPHLTGLDLECAGIESTQKVLDAARGLEESGHLSKTDDPAAVPENDSDVTVLVIPPELEDHYHAIEFAASIYAKGTDGQATALTMMVHLEQVAVNEGWPKDGDITGLVGTLKPNLDDDTTAMLLRGVAIATQARLEWPHIRARL